MLYRKVETPEEARGGDAFMAFVVPDPQATAKAEKWAAVSGVMDDARPPDIPLNRWAEMLHAGWQLWHQNEASAKLGAAVRAWMLQEGWGLAAIQSTCDHRIAYVRHLMTAIAAALEAENG